MNIYKDCSFKSYMKYYHYRAHDCQLFVHIGPKIGRYTQISRPAVSITELEH